MPIPGFVDTGEACRILVDISRQRLHFLAGTGRIPYVWIGGRRIYRRDDVLKLKRELGRCEQMEMDLSSETKAG